MTADNDDSHPIYLEKSENRPLVHAHSLHPSAFFLHDVTHLFLCFLEKQKGLIMH